MADLAEFSEPKTIAPNLFLRLATLTDLDRLVPLVEQVFYKGLAVSLREFLEAHENGWQDNEFFIIEDTKEQQIAALTGLMALKWRYDTEILDVGRIDFVGTHPDYRQIGLSKIVIDACHQLSQAKGHHIQIVEGIPWYYRKFDYEYAVAGLGEYTLPMSKISTLESPYRVRLATLKDVPTLVNLYNKQCVGNLVAQYRDEAYFRYQIEQILQGALAIQINSVVDIADNLVGYYSTWADKPYGQLILRELGVIDPSLYEPVLMAGLRHMQAYFAKNRDLFDADFAGEVYSTLGKNHPASKFIVPEDATLKPENWYVRVPDYAVLLNQIKPVLNERLAQSAQSAYSGELNISFYTHGVSLRIDNGQISEIGAWQPPDISYRTAAFPFQTFSKLVFGYRSLTDIQYMYPDCRVDAFSAELLNILFPKQQSWVIY